MKIKFIADHKEKTIIFFFLEDDVREVAVVCAKKSISPEQASHRITNKLCDLIDIVCKQVNINLLSFKPDMKILTKENFDKVKPSKNSDIIYIKEITEKRKVKECDP